jgi:flagellar biosynthesis protein FlhF
LSIKTFRGRTIAEALDALKRDMGRDAVILNTRTFKAGGLFGFGARTITEIIATTAGEAGRKADARTAKARNRAPGTSATPTSAPAPAPAPAPRVVTAAAGTYRPMPGAVSRVPSDPRAGERDPEPIAPADPRNFPIRDVAKLIVAANTKTPIEEELASIKKMVAQVMRTSAGSRQPTMPDALFDCYRRLLEAEVAAEIADEITSAVRSELSTEQLADPAKVNAAVTRQLAGLIPVSADSSRPCRGPDGRPLTIALVGPTGVGKTTTLAKLAATYKLRHGLRVGLITADTYRIAAVDQLRTYAEIIGLPLRVAMTPSEVRAAVHSLAECDVILIDTAGRSPRDSARLAELRAMLDAAQPHQRHLVLSSTASESALNETASAFAPLAYDRVILTKLDEAVNFGVLVNVCRRLETRLSFVTHGQEVPDHIEAGNPERLARAILAPPGTEVLR